MRPPTSSLSLRGAGQAVPDADRVPPWLQGKGAGQGGASDHLPSTDRKQAGGARGHFQGRGQPPALQGRPQRTEPRPFCCLRTSVFRSAICVWLGVGARRRGREREREGEGKGGDSGVVEPPCLPPSFLGARGWEDLAFCCWRRPPSQQPWETTMGDHHGPSFLRCLLKPAFPLYPQDTQLQTPRRGPAASPRASALPPRGCPGRCPLPPPRPPAEPAAHSLCSHWGKSHAPYRPVASDHPPRRGREAMAPPCLRHPSRSGAWSRERPREGRGCSEGARDRGWAPGQWTPPGPPSQARGPVTPGGGRSGFCRVSN